MRLFFKSIFWDTFSLWYRVPKASCMSLVVFFLKIWGIRWSFMNLIGFASCSSWGSVGSGTTFSMRYHKSALSKRFYNLIFHNTKLEAPSNKWLSLILGVTIATINLNKRQPTIIGWKIEFHTPQPFLGLSAYHWHNSTSITEAWTHCPLKP